jgi:rhodanese-related sulfurtransferase
MQKPITKQQIEELQQQNSSVKLIDIRPAAEYEKMQVPGSINMPAETIAENISKFSANDTIVCVCTKGLERSQNAADTIALLGFDNVFYLEKGVVGWGDE